MRQLGSSDPSQAGIIRRALSALCRYTVEEKDLTQSQRKAIAQHKVAVAQRDVAITSKIWKLFKPYTAMKRLISQKAS